MCVSRVTSTSFARFLGQKNPIFYFQKVEKEAMLGVKFRLLLCIKNNANKVLVFCAILCNLVDS
jgi:hypothetical protein